MTSSRSIRAAEPGGVVADQRPGQLGADGLVGDQLTYVRLPAEPRKPGGRGQLAGLSPSPAPAAVPLGAVSSSGDAESPALPVVGASPSTFLG